MPLILFCIPHLDGEEEKESESDGEEEKESDDDDHGDDHDDDHGDDGAAIYRNMVVYSGNDNHDSAQQVNKKQKHTSLKALHPSNFNLNTYRSLALASASTFTSASSFMVGLWRHVGIADVGITRVSSFKLYHRYYRYWYRAVVKINVRKFDTSLGACFVYWTVQYVKYGKRTAA